MMFKKKMLLVVFVAKIHCSQRRGNEKEEKSGYRLDYISTQTS